jgi:membrane fusion protein (multidrug efflux system)
VVQIAPQVPAPVIALHINDNQLVRQGDLMIELDPTDYEVALEQAQAQLAASQGRLAQAQAQEESAKASVDQAAAEVDAAQVSLDNANKDLQRYESVDERARSRQQLDNAITTQKNAQAQLDQARARKVSADASVSTAIASIKAAQGDVRTSEANVRRAQVNLGYCHIYAPADGRVTQRTVEVGNFVQTGSTMFMLVSPTVWVTANFKETQLKHMRPGQPVSIKVDAFSDRELNGHVDSIQAGSGSRFSILPAENATGNFVKIVQRVPVKILFDYGGNTNDAGLLSPGLSVVPKVRVR